MTPEAIVRIYIHKIRPRARAEIDWFAGQPSLEVAIEKAALAVNSRGKRYSHQRRLKKVALKQALGALLDESEAIKQARDFHHLFELIEGAVKEIPGIGELYVYDTAFRMGANLNLFPARIYLHAGTRRGARALGLDGIGATLKVSALPKAFRILEPHELEDVLCIFKDKLKIALAPPSGEDIVKRSWCN
jgi:hypothetical protein